jgi:ATP-dependent exoDNAse (exonuclease V) beta subunit
MGVAAMNNEFSQLIEFDVVHPDLENGRIIEASAGSGKTFSVAGMVAHEIATNSDLRMTHMEEKL